MPFELPFYANLSMYVSLTIGSFMIICTFAYWKRLHKQQRFVRILLGLMLLYSVIVRIVYYSTTFREYVNTFFFTTAFDIFYILICGTLISRMIRTEMFSDDRKPK
jgi:hypothetical protein